MTDESRRPRNLHDALVRLNEECVEVAKECCKALRFGIFDVNPREIANGDNSERIKNEMSDVIDAYKDFERFLEMELDVVDRYKGGHEHQMMMGHCTVCGAGWASID